MRFTARHAVILAAGRGERLRPITDKTPKPLLVYDGKPIIERIIERVQGAGIKDVIVVTGYKSAMFDYLPSRFANVTLRFNDRWSEGNNILSVLAVMEDISDALVINGDAIITRDVLSREYYGTTMYADRAEGFSKEWELVLNQDGLVDRINVAGGKDILQQREITFVCNADFLLFKERVLARVTDGKLDDFFEFCLFPALKIHVAEVAARSIFDLDSLEE